MDFNAAVALTFFSILIFFIGYIMKGTGLGTGFHVLSMLLFILLGFCILTENLTYVVYADGSVVSIPVSLGINSEWLSLVYLSLSLLVFYSEF